MRHISTMKLAVCCAAALFAVAVGASGAAAGDGEPTPSPTATPSKNTCLAGKTKCVGKYLTALLKCAEKCQKNPKDCGGKELDCNEKAESKFAPFDEPAKGCFEKLESKEKPEKPETICVTVDDTAAMEAKVDLASADLLDALHGNPPAVCGDGVAEGNESCDGLDLAGVDCATLGYDTGTLACTPGCGFDTTGCAATCGLSMGALVGGGCWFYGDAGESCDTVCDNAGGDYDDLTRTFAGSDGTQANCDRVLAKLAAVGAPVPADVNGSTDGSAFQTGVGCNTGDSTCPETVDDSGSCWRRDQTPTTAGGARPATARACACVPL